MIEARKGQIVVFLTDFGELEGSIDCIDNDRIIVNIFSQDRLKFSNLVVGSMIKTFVHTKSGIKKMYPVLIENNDNCVVIENAPTIDETQNRENVRIICDKIVYIKYNSVTIKAQTIDLSAGGVKFELLDRNDKIAISSDVFVMYDDDELPKEPVKAKITKNNSDRIYVAQFTEKNANIINNIAKFCMRNFN